jgi:SAM-dependent methyltransferase
VGSGLVLLNLGCGNRTHPMWVNIDYTLSGRIRSIPFIGRFAKLQPVGYRNWDLRRGIPFKSGTVDVVYSSHVLEHLDRSVAGVFLREAARVLKPGGIIRIVVPDLEDAVRTYITALEKMREGQPTKSTKEEYELATLLMLDQLVRRESGGELAAWLRSHSGSAIIRKKGGVFEAIAASESKLERLPDPARKILRHFGFLDPAKKGELHRWMYDDVSLKEQLAVAGFSDVRRMTPGTSRITNWESFHLDLNEDGTVHQPGSIWMEGIK